MDGQNPAANLTVWRCRVLVRAITAHMLAATLYGRATAPDCRIPRRLRERLAWTALGLGVVDREGLASGQRRGSLRSTWNGLAVVESLLGEQELRHSRRKRQSFSASPWVYVGMPVQQDQVPLPRGTRAHHWW